MRIPSDRRESREAAILPGRERSAGASGPGGGEPDWPSLWSLDPEVAFLNHGSFGACPVAVLKAQQRLRDRLERQPLLFLGREIEALLDDSRRELAEFLGADPDDVVFLPNATAGVNTVLRSLHFGQGDELLVTDHEYNACRNALDFAAAGGARVVVAEVPFPLDSPRRVVDSILELASSRTRLALLDHITSPTGLILPAEEIAGELAARGTPCLIDGAHAPGMVPLRLRELGTDFYTGNCHKWLCAPKGSGFLYVRRERQAEIRPLAISHGANSPRTDRSLFQLEFGWTGTCDPTPFLCVAESIRYLGSLLPGGWAELMERNRSLALRAREVVCREIKIPAPCPDEMIGSLASVPLPDGDPQALLPPLYIDPLQTALYDRYRIEVPVVPWFSPGRRYLRISAQLYNSIDQYERLARAVRELLEARL